MDADFNIRGLKELNKELKSLPEDFRTKSLNGAVAASARVLRNEAIKNAPSDTGNLKTAIRAQKKRSKTKYIGLYQVNVKPKGKVTILTRGKKRRSNSTYYARFLEDGTKKMPPQPFMRPAFMSKREESVRTFRKVLDRKIRLSQKKIRNLA